MSMRARLTRRTLSATVILGLLTQLTALHAQAPSPPAPQLPAPDAQAPTCSARGPMGAPTYKSVEQLADGRVAFRLCAPNAAWVSVTSTDMPDVIPMRAGGGFTDLAMSRDERGLWSVTTPVPVAPDTYRFNFNVDGVAVPDPQGTTFSLTRSGQFSTLEVFGPTGAFQSYDKGVPHGAVTVIEYWSASLATVRRAHVYTPPGYMRDNARYPVLYLVHGAGDSDDSWTSVGHANYIVDNLIASSKAKPMIVVMPFGHTPQRQGVNVLSNNDFSRDFLEDLMPYVEANFRTLNSRSSRAMAGLSMGGAHTLRVGLTHPELFAYTGIFSMGLLHADQVADYETQNAIALTQAGKSMRLVYYAMGKTDFLYASAAPTRAMMEKYGMKPVYNESEGGHVWINWRRYLEDFAPRLFR